MKYTDFENAFSLERISRYYTASQHQPVSVVMTILMYFRNWTTLTNFETV